MRVSTDGLPISNLFIIEHIAHLGRPDRSDPAGERRLQESGDLSRRGVRPVGGEVITRKSLYL